MKKIIGCIVAVTGLILVGTGIYLKYVQAISISIIGGADGPTSIFLAGKLPSTGGTGMIIAGVVILIVLAVWSYYYKKNIESGS